MLLCPELLGGSSADHSHVDGTAVPTETITALNGSVGEAAEAALNGADASTISADLADTTDDTSVGGTAGGSGSGRDGEGDRGRSAGVGVNCGTVTGDGAAGEVALLLDGERLEHGVRLGCRGVDGEDHALSAVVALTAVEPFERR